MCGGNDTPAAPSASSIANEQTNALISNIPRTAQLNWDVLNNPTYGLGPTSQLYEDVRSQVFPQEQAVRQQLASNILQSLINPQGQTEQQTAAVKANRDTAQNELVKAIRNRQNLGGKLYGGGGGWEESEAVGNLQNQFAETDITRDSTSRLNAIQSAIPFLQLLFPNVQLQNPQYINPVPSADTSMNSAVASRGQDIQSQANQNALYASLFGTVGQAAGAAMMPAASTTNMFL